MKHIVLMCAAGASTSMLVKRMQQAADAAGYECTVEAHPVSDAAQYADVDVILLGPQVRFQLASVKSKVNCPVEPIDMRDYGAMNGEAVIAQARKAMGE
ncbi:MAG TPA: PTS sugar transporter subunit IIB [Candidatus Coprousia avicola]|nr:PTS sugar transporter subunit IIB [Candidatus Coprousia avicola]